MRAASVYPRYTPRGNLTQRALAKFSRPQRERFFLLVVRMVGRLEITREREGLK